MKKFFLLVLLAIISISCGTFKQLQQIAALRNCSFDLKNVESVEVAGIDVKNLKNLTANDLIKLGLCVATKSVPISMVVDVEVGNDSKSTTTVTNMDWICTVDGKNLAKGTINDNFNILAGSVVQIPIKVDMDAYSLFSSTGVDAIKTFINSFSKETSTSSRIEVKVKPTLEAGAAKITFPKYITLLSNK